MKEGFRDETHACVHACECACVRVCVCVLRHFDILPFSIFRSTRDTSKMLKECQIMVSKFQYFGTQFMWDSVEPVVKTCVDPKTTQIYQKVHI